MKFSLIEILKLDDI